MVDFTGQYVACIASGPSLTREDCDAVRDAGLPAVVINSSYKLAPWAAILYAADYAWWQANETAQHFAGACYTVSQRAAKDYHLYHHKTLGENNSGARAIELALQLGAEGVLLLGYDVSLQDGRAHHHAPHAGSTNPTADDCRRWLRIFEHLARKYPGRVANASRRTALTCFPRCSLADALQAHARVAA